MWTSSTHGNPPDRGAAHDAAARTPYAGAMNLLEDPGRFHWKWIVIGVGLLIVYAIERSVRTGGLF